MTKEEAKQWIPILTAYSEGKQIQTFVSYKNMWENLDEPNFDSKYGPKDYRIKPPEPKYREWSGIEDILGRKMRWKSSPEHEYVFVSHYKDERRVGVYKRDGVKTYNYEYLLEHCEWFNHNEEWGPCCGGICN